MKIVLY